MGNNQRETTILKQNYITGWPSAIGSLLNESLYYIMDQTLRGDAQDESCSMCGGSLCYDD